MGVLNEYYWFFRADNRKYFRKTYFVACDYYFFGRGGRNFVYAVFKTYNFAVWFYLSVFYAQKLFENGADAPRTRKIATAIRER